MERTPVGSSVMSRGTDWGYLSCKSRTFMLKTPHPSEKIPLFLQILSEKLPHLCYNEKIINQDHTPWPPSERTGRMEKSL